jgi:hypothetical protein
VFLQMVEKGHKPSQVSFRRIKVLMELANKHEALENLSEKMAGFGRLVHVPKCVDSPTDPLDLDSFPVNHTFVTNHGHRRC